MLASWECAELQIRFVMRLIVAEFCHEYATAEVEFWT